MRALLSCDHGSAIGHARGYLMALSRVLVAAGVLSVALRAVAAQATEIVARFLALKGVKA